MCFSLSFVMYYSVFVLFSVDALYAVYEASTLEFWSLMMYTAAEGNSGVVPFIFYFFLVLFVVYILQVNIHVHVYWYITCVSVGNGLRKSLLDIIIISSISRTTDCVIFSFSIAKYLSCCDN